MKGISGAGGSRFPDDASCGANASCAGDADFWCSRLERLVVLVVVRVTVLILWRT